jgi:signal transduction histidine kinase
MDEVVGNMPSVLKGPETPESVYEDLWKTISRGDSWSGEFHNRKKDGSTYWAHASISGLRDEAGVVRHYVGVQVDITRRKELEVQLEAQNAELERLNRLKGDMVAITSHDLKSPLHAMVSVASLLRDLGPQLDAEARADFIDQIIASGRKLSLFISDILDAEKIEAGGISLILLPTRVEQVVEDCVAMAGSAARENSIEITLVIDGSFGEMLVDAGKLEQVFANLLSNAIKFSSKGSTVEVRMALEEGHQVITIGDRGPGVPEDERERIFDRYYQAASGNRVAERGFGVGLGLYIVRQLVEAHGGSVEARNREGGGCLFVVRLPEVQHDIRGGHLIDQTGSPDREGTA